MYTVCLTLWNFCSDFGGPATATPNLLLACRSHLPFARLHTSVSFLLPQKNLGFLGCNLKTFLSFNLLQQVARRGSQPQPERSKFTSGIVHTTLVSPLKKKSVFMRFLVIGSNFFFLSLQSIGRRFFRCPAAVAVHHFQKLLSLKFELPPQYAVRNTFHSNFTLCCFGISD